jgi:hypothetical protein
MLHRSLLRWVSCNATLNKGGSSRLLLSPYPDFEKALQGFLKVVETPGGKVCLPTFSTGSVDVLCLALFTGGVAILLASENEKALWAYSPRIGAIFNPMAVQEQTAGFRER